MGAKGAQALPIFGTTKKRFQETHIRFASVVLDGVLGPSHLLHANI